MVDKPYDKVEELYKFVSKPVTEKVTSFVDTSMNGEKASSNFNVRYLVLLFISPSRSALSFVSLL